MAKNNKKTKKEERKKIDFKYNISEYLSLLKNYKLLVTGMLILTIIVELRFLVDKFLFKIVIDNGTEFVNGTLQASEYTHILFNLAAIFVSLLVVSYFLIWFKEHLIIKVGTNLIRDIKVKYFNHILSLHHDFHTTHKTGSMISRLLRGGWTVDRMNDTLIYEFAPLTINIVVISFTLLYFDVFSAIVSFVISIVFVSYGLFIQRIQQSANLRAIEAEDYEKGNVSDFFTNIDSIKYFGKDRNIRKRYSDINMATKEAQRTHWNYFRWYGSGLIFIQGIGLFLVVYFSLLKFLAGDMTIGSLVFIFTAYGSLIGPMWMFNNGIRNFYRSMADFQDLFYYGKIHNNIKDKKNAENLVIENGEIEFKDIDFNYGKRNIFKEFNLKIPKNKKIALVGHSGCGKTTLVKLLYRFYDVNSGAVLIDGMDIRDFRQESVRSEMSIVPQECVLFDDTVYNNIAFSNPKATRNEVMQAIKFAQLDKIINEFPKKEKTIVGERGVKLSGGEKQRVSIARAILANKKILVLDEATSSLDSETEHEIQRDLQNLMKGRTSIVIAHRLSTIMSADKIVVMKRGKIVQTGTHKQLISKPGEYNRLWNLQKGGYIK